MPLKRQSNRANTFSDLPGDRGLAGLGRTSDAKWDVSSFGGQPTLGGHALRASLTTALAGTNNDLVWEALDGGTQGNDIRVRYVVAGASTPLTVAVSAKDITVNVATNGSSVATSTATQVADAVAASTAASQLVRKPVNAAGNDGTGVVAALGFTNLAGGTDFTMGR